MLGVTPGSEQPVSALLRTLSASADGNPGASIRRGILDPFDVNSVLVHALRDDTLVLVAHAGITEHLERHFATVAKSVRTPMAEAMRTGIDISLASDQWATAFPLAALLVQPEAGHSPWLSVHVLRRAGIPMGTLTLGYARVPQDTGDLHRRLEALSDALALWASSEDLPTPTPTQESWSVTPRQREIIALVSEGETNTQISERLHVSVATVKSDLAVLFELLGAKKRSELPARAIRSGV